MQDRQGLQKLLQELDVFENGTPYDKEDVIYHDSKLIRNAKHIQSFIDEVTRKKEFQSKEKPCFNWINIFNDFSDIIRVLIIEMQFKSNISRQIAELSLQTALVQNLKELSYKSNSGGVSAYFVSFEPIRRKIDEALKKCIDKPTLLNGFIQLTSKDVQDMSHLLLFYYIGADTIESYAFEQAVSSGVFLNYNKKKACYESDNISLALYEMIREIKKLKRRAIEFPYDVQGEMLDTIRDYNVNSDKTYQIRTHHLILLNGIYECQRNIYSLTQYLMRHILHHDNINDYPVLLSGFVEDLRPPEIDVLSVFQ